MSGDFWSYDQTRANLASLTVVDELGAGSYSTVYKGIYKGTEETPRTCAIKQQAIYEQDDSDCGVSYSFLTELNNLQLFRHYNIVKLYGVFFYLNTTNLVCEQMDCDLTYYIKTMPARRRLHHTRKLLVSLVKAVMLLNDLGYHHFDIKPSNVLVKFSRVTSDDIPEEEEDVFKLADFGIAFSTAAYFDYKSKEVCTLWYRPPELHADQCYYKDKPDLLSKGDIWSIGLTVLEMITKRAVIRVRSASELPPILMNLVDPLYLFGVPLTRHQRQCFDWLKALRKGLLRGHLDLVQIISPELFVELNYLDTRLRTEQSNGSSAKQGEKQSPSRVLKILQDMLELSPKHRISGDDILYRLDEKVELNYLEDNYGRFINPVNIRVLIKLGIVLECSNETLVYALDFLLRYEHQVKQGLVTVIIPQLSFSDECELELNPTILKKRTKYKQCLDPPMPRPPPQIKSISLFPDSSESEESMNSEESEESTDTLDIDRVVRETMMNEFPIRPLSSSYSSDSSDSSESESSESETLEVLGSKIKLEKVVGVEMIEIIAILKLAADLNQPGRYMTDDLLNLITWNKNVKRYRQEFIEAQKRVLTGINFTLSTYFNQIYIEWLHNNKDKAIKWTTMSKMDEFSWLQCFFDEDLDLDDFFDTKDKGSPK